jgi:hypothetical protein
MIQPWRELLMRWDCSPWCHVNLQVYVENRSRYSRLETGTEKPARYDWGCHTLHLSQWNKHGVEQIRIPINSWVEHIPIQMARMAFQRETSYSIRKGSRTYAWRWEPMITMVFVELDPLTLLKWTSWNIYYIVYYILYSYIYIIFYYIILYYMFFIYNYIILYILYYIIL